MKTRPIIWTMGGSDSGGSAGIQADLRAIGALGGHGVSILTAVTAQNPSRVASIHPVPATEVRSQILSAWEELPPHAVKTGMLGESGGTRALAECLAKTDVAVVCDPVLRSSSGYFLLPSEKDWPMAEFLFPLTRILTPNLFEGAHLTQGNEEDSRDTMAVKLLRRGVREVVIKGGHAESDWASDYWNNGNDFVWLHSLKRKGLKTHGTGCTFASALTTALALGKDSVEAAVTAKIYVNVALRNAYFIGEGSPVLAGDLWPHALAAEDLPFLSKDPTPPAFSFPDCGKTPIGFYPIVPNATWVERLSHAGVSCVQLRIKDLTGEALEKEIRRAVRISKTTGMRLFINDHWEVALAAGAYGVHLGQEDLEHCDLKKLQASGLRLGVSTHNLTELARAAAIKPSYLALGPIFSTTAKPMRFGPQGVENLRLWRKLTACPLVAIGGITLEKAGLLFEAGADGISVISDLVNSDDWFGKSQRWLEVVSGAQTGSKQCNHWPSR